MTSETISFNKGVTVKQLKDFLASVPDDVEIEVWANGDGGVDDVTLEIEHYEGFGDDVSLNIGTYNTIM